MPSEFLAHARFFTGVARTLRHPIRPAEAEEALRRSLGDREKSFLDIARTSIFENAHSPYHPLLDSAGCEYGDLSNSVRSHGIEGTLHKLREAGVFVTFDELKGRKPIERNGRSLSVQPSQFINPRNRRYIPGSTGGSTGRPTPIPLSLDRLVDAAPYRIVVYKAHGVEHGASASWRPLPPAPTGVTNAISAILTGHKFEKWFSLPVDRDLRTKMRSAAYMRGLGLAWRMAGLRLPRPEPVAIDDAVVIARWAAGRATKSESAVLRTTVSMAMRVAQAATDAGIDLTGVWMNGGGEPSTEAKARIIRATGAGWLPNYIATEIGHIGMACANPVQGDDLHLLEDKQAVIQHPRVLPSGETVLPLLFTSLSSFSALTLLNVEADDCAVIEERRCGCLWDELGFHKHIHSIYSFGKLTGGGVTFAGTEMSRILDTLLPARFGGTPNDYQMVEEEHDGHTRLVVVISPSVGAVEETAVTQCILDGLGTSNLAADIRAYWRGSNAIRVRREAPTITNAGKVMPLRTDKERWR